MQMNKVFDFFISEIFSKKNISVSSIFLLNSFASKTEFRHSSDQDAKETAFDCLRGHAYLPPQFF